MTFCEVNGELIKCKIVLDILEGQKRQGWVFQCEGEVIVQGDEGPVLGVAQVVDCHGVTVGHEEKEEEVEERQEVESDEEKTLKERCAYPWMG